MPEEAELVRINLRKGLYQLIRIPLYTLYLISSFLILGAIYANNFYFAFFYTSIGGTLAGFGLVFFLSAVSEAPFMRIAGAVIRRYGIMTVLIFAAILSAARYLFFFTEPSTTWVLLVSIIHGISIGFFIPAGVELVRILSPEDVKVTGMSIYSAVSNGLGAMAFTYLGGYIFEHYSIAHTYLFFSIATIVGVLILCGMIIYSRRKFNLFSLKEIN
jgi:PPP family 3-phenylpropionic acid transporter